MYNFYESIVEDSEMTFVGRLVIVLLIAVMFFAPYFVGLTNKIINEESRQNIFAITFMCVIIWVVSAIALFVALVALNLLVKSITWIITGYWPNWDTDDYWDCIGKKICSPFIFVFNFIFCYNEDKNELLKNIFKSKSEKAKDLLNE